MNHSINWESWRMLLLDISFLGSSFLGDVQLKAQLYWNPNYEPLNLRLDLSMHSVVSDDPSQIDNLGSRSSLSSWQNGNDNARPISLWFQSTSQGRGQVVAARLIESLLERTKQLVDYIYIYIYMQLCHLFPLKPRVYMFSDNVAGNSRVLGHFG